MTDLKNELQLKSTEKKFYNTFAKKISDKNVFEKYKHKVAQTLGDKNHGPVKKIWDQVLLLWSYVKDNNIQWQKKIMPLAGLLYLVSPIDAIPDVPPLGYIDDAAVLVAITKFMADELKKYTETKATVEAQIKKPISKKRISLIATTMSVLYFF